MKHTKTILLVDDEAVNLRLLKNVLAEQYHLVFAKSGEEAIRLTVSGKPDLILMDVMMPGMTGFDACKAIKQQPEVSHIPVIFVTALNDVEDETLGFEAGGVDYITKPFSPAVVHARVKTHLSLVQIDELKRTQLQIVQHLGRAAEFKDNETGTHVLRMSHYSQLLARHYGMDESEAEELLYAAPMHDIGKIGIPDAVLQKPGKLTEEEYAVMQQHPKIGADIIGDADTALMKTARTVALYHHEKWDGTGYPHGLSGDDIPLVARIVAVADVFDALTSTRPYKAAWSVENAIEFMQQQKGKHFEPKLIDVLIDNLDAFLKIKHTWQDDV